MEGGRVGILSTDPIVLVGPGSEWFWSMAQFVVVGVTLIGIYYQFRLQRATNAFEQLNRITAEWGTEPLLRARLRVARAAEAGEPPPPGAVSLIGNYWEMVASLVRGGHIEARVVYESVGGSPLLWWAVLADTTRDGRARLGDPTIFEHFEWLVEKFTAWDASHGVAALQDRPERGTVLAASISDLADRILMIEESRMVAGREQAPPRRLARSRTNATRAT